MPIFSEKELLLWVVRKLRQNKIDYMLTGSLATSFWGIPRSTHDIDVVIALKPTDIEKMKLAFKNQFYLSKKAAQEAWEKKSMFNLIHSDTGLKVDFWILQFDPYHQKAFQRRKTVKIYGEKINLAAPEDTIISKLLWYQKSQSQKHLDDIRGILAVQSNKIDRNYIKEWAEKLKIEEIWGNLQSIR